MSDMLEELAGLMEAEIALQEQTLEKLMEQQDILVACELDRLESNLKALEELRTEVMRRERERTAEKKRIARLLKIEGDTPSLVKLLEEARGPLCDRLTQLSGRFMALLKAIRRQSRKNMVLIRQSLELNQALLTQITGKNKEQALTYGQRGEFIPSSQSGVVNAKA
jgi:hypothetical protein